MKLGYKHSLIISLGLSLIKERCILELINVKHAFIPELFKFVQVSL